MTTITQPLAKLAIHGGKPAVPPDESDEQLFHWPIVTEEDEQAILDVVRRGQMSAGEITREFEREFAAWTGSKYALGYCNGTSSLLAAMWACGVGAGDEIICPSITYWASAAQAQSLGAAVHFADIDPETLCLDPNDLEHRIGPRTKAIVVVHYCAHPADMDPILAIARKHGIKVIEDVSHAQGARYKGRMCGTMGDVAGISLMAGKSFAIGEAGMLLTDDREIYERAIAFGHYELTGGPSRFAKSQTETHGDLSKFSGIPIGGHKHRMNQTCSAMGRVQLKYYEQRTAVIRKALNRFWSLLEDVPGLYPHKPKWPDSHCGGWYYPHGLYRSEELGGLSCARFCEAVRAEGVPMCTMGSNFPLHTHTVFHEADVLGQGRPTALAFGQRDVRQGLGTLPVAERINDITFAVPWFKHDRPQRIEQYANAFRKVAEAALRDELTTSS